MKAFGDGCSNGLGMPESENGGGKDVHFRVVSTSLLVRPPGSVQERSESEWSSFISPPRLSLSLSLLSAMSTSLPTAKIIHVETRGAVILDEASPEVRALSAY